MVAAAIAYGFLFRKAFSGIRAAQDSVDVINHPFENGLPGPMR
jgi:hypothetical protein